VVKEEGSQRNQRSWEKISGVGRYMGEVQLHTVVVT
jgi:hypothetical protein